MVRSALADNRRIGRGPHPMARLIPAASVIGASYLIALPIVSQTGWWPDFGFLVFLAWRLLRADAWPAWWAAPLGFVHDLLTGAPVGMSVALWTAIMLAMDLVDRRTQWRDYWIEWALAAVLIGADKVAEWKVAELSGASFPLAQVLQPLVISIVAFPVAAWLVARLDRWRLGR